MHHLDPKDRPTYAELVDYVNELEHQLAMARARIEGLEDQVQVQYLEGQIYGPGPF